MPLSRTLNHGRMTSQTARPERAGFIQPAYRVALGNLERELTRSTEGHRFVEYQRRIAEIESAVRLLKVARPFEVDLQRLRIHLRMVQEAGLRDRIHEFAGLRKAERGESLLHSHGAIAQQIKILHCASSVSDL